MASAAARALVAQLQNSGLSLAMIGRALERDSSQLSQIARGARGAGYGEQLVAPLQALAQRLTTESGSMLPAGQAQRAARIIAETNPIAAPRRMVRDTRANAPAGAVRAARVRQGVRAAGKPSARLRGAFTSGSGSARSSTGLGQLFGTSDSTGQRIYLAVTLKDGRKVGLGARTADEWRQLGIQPGGGGGGSLGSQLAGAADDTVYELDDAVADWTAGLIAED